MKIKMDQSFRHVLCTCVQIPYNKLVIFQMLVRDIHSQLSDIFHNLVAVAQKSIHVINCCLFRSSISYIQR